MIWIRNDKILFQALLVIFPLLGITYLITIANPNKYENMAFEYVRATLLSIQVNIGKVIS